MSRFSTLELSDINECTNTNNTKSSRPFIYLFIQQIIKTNERKIVITFILLDYFFKSIFKDILLHNRF